MLCVVLSSEEEFISLVYIISLRKFIFAFRLHKISLPEECSDVVLLIFFFFFGADTFENQILLML